jgi:hypothetical protein
MALEKTSDTSIGPPLSLDEFALPPHVGTHLAALFDRETPITTGAEWVETMRTTFEQQGGQAPTEADLCHVEDGRHTVEIDGERRSFVCVLDPMIVPFLREEPARIESTTPGTDATVSVSVDATGVTTSPTEAVISLGVARDLETTTPSPETVYGQVCEYVHAFPSPGAYERWADEVDAATTSVPAETGIAVARELATALFET